MRVRKYPNQRQMHSLVKLYEFTNLAKSRRMEEDSDHVIRDHEKMITFLQSHFP